MIQSQSKLQQSLIMCLMIMIFILSLQIYSYARKTEESFTILNEVEVVIEENHAEHITQNNVIYNEIKNIKKESNNITLQSNRRNVTNRWNIELTSNEIDLLARIVMLEAGGECDWGKDAVVEVIFNRIYDEDFPNTLEGVLSQDDPVQFTSWENRNSQAATPTQEVYESIYYVLSGKTDIFPFETVYFGRAAHNENIQLVIENHVFCNK